MASVNKVTIIGNLGKDPEMRAMPSGDEVANVVIATSLKYKTKAGGMVDETEWHRVTFFGKLAEIAGKYLKKGSQVYIEGRIKTNKFTDKDGVEKFSVSIIAHELKMLGKKEDAQPSTQSYSQPNNAPAKPKPQAMSVADMDDDIPF